MRKQRLHSILLTVLLLISSNTTNVATAFTVTSPSVLTTSTRHLTKHTVLAQAQQSDNDNKSVSITSGRKEIAYDETTGRFFETDLQEEECIPEEEFCMIDKTSGKTIRLTVEEKERIFLDALQVRPRARSVCAYSTAGCFTNFFFLALHLFFIITFYLLGLLFQWSKNVE
jgi:hypothetical protein